MKKKKEKPIIVCSVDLQQNWHNNSVSAPLYEIHFKGKEFIVMYHGCCAIYNSTSLEEAQEYIRQHLAKWNRTEAV